VSSFDAIYRLTIYSDEAMTTALTPAAGAVHSDPFQVATARGVAGFQPYMSFPEGRAGEFGPKDRNTDTGQIRIQLLDVRLDRTTSNLERWVTAFVGDADGEPQIGGQKVLVEESLDGGATWADYFTGRINAPSLKSRAVFALTIRDLKGDLKIPTFYGRPHSSITYAHACPLLPIGLPFTWADAKTVSKIPSTTKNPGLVPARLEVDVGSLPDDLLERLVVTKALHDEAESVAGSNLGTDTGISIISPPSPIKVNATITSGARSGESGQFSLLAGFGTGIFGTAFGAIGTEDTEAGQHRVTSIGITELDSSDPQYLALPPDGASVDFWLESGRKPTKDTPILIEDVHPVRLAKDLLDGDFDLLKLDGSHFRSFSYIDPDNLENDPSFGTFRGLIREPPDDKWKWLREHLFKPYGFGLYLNASGEAVFTDLRTPPKATASGLPQITQAMVAQDETPAWEHSRDDAITRIDFTYYLDEFQDVSEVETKGEYPDVSPFLVESKEVPFQILDVGDPTLPQSKYEIDAIGFRSTTTETGRGIQDRLAKVAQVYRVPFSRGPEYLRLPLRRSEAVVQAITPGDFLEVQADVLPDPRTNVRGGARVMQAIGVTPKRGVVEVRFLDLFDAAIATAPTFPSGDPTAAQGTDLAYTITQAVTADADGPAVVEYNVTDTSVGVRPADDDAGWRFMGSKVAGGTQEPKAYAIGAGKRIWTRARTESPKMVFSDWVYPTPNGYVDTGAIAAVTGLTQETNTGTRSKWSWTVGDSDLRVKVTVTDTTTGEARDPVLLAAGSEVYEVRGTTAGDAYQIDVVQVDEVGGVGTTATGTWTAGTAGGGTGTETAPRPLGLDPIFVAYGQEVDYSKIGVAFWVYAADPSIPLVLQVADEDAGNPGNPDLATISEILLPAGTTQYTYLKRGLEVLQQSKFFRLIHRGAGYTDSSPTSWIEHALYYIPKNLGARPPSPNLVLDLRLDRTTGDVALEIDGASSCDHARYYTSTASFPGPGDPYSTKTLDANGDGSVAPVDTIMKGDTLYVYVEVYTSTNSATPLATARRSITWDDILAGDIGLPPKATFTRKSFSTSTLTYTVDAVAGEGGTANLEAKYRVNGPGSAQGSWSSYAAVPFDVAVTRDYTEDVELEVVPRDTGLSGSPEGEHAFRTIPPVLEGIGGDGRFRPDVPGSGRNWDLDGVHTGARYGPHAIGREPQVFQGFGGTAPSTPKAFVDVMSDDGMTKLIEAATKRIQSGLLSTDDISVVNKIARLASSGALDETASVEVSGTLRKIARGIILGTAKDGDAVDFTTVISGGFGSTPAVLFGPPPYTYHPSIGSGAKHWLVAEPENLDELGFDMLLEFQDRTSTTGRQDNFPSGTINSNGGTIALGGLSFTAVDGKYTTYFSGNVYAQGGPGEFDLTTCTAVVEIQSKVGSGSWVTKGSKSYQVTANGNSATNSDSFSDSIQFTQTALGAGDDIRVKLTWSLSGPGSSVGSGSADCDPNHTNYTSASVSHYAINDGLISFLALEGQ